MKADAVYVDAPLSPVQVRNLAAALPLGMQLHDRVGVILRVFAARARTREARIQVELAQLSVARSRLAAGGAGDAGTAARLSQQRGGTGAIGGGGETQLELDRRVLDRRAAQLARELDDVRRTRALHRASRARSGLPSIALVGYTNAGKSSLAAALTCRSWLPAPPDSDTGRDDASAAPSHSAHGDGQRASATKFKVKDQLFATLDSTAAALTLPSGLRALVVDTVGFVSGLPHELVASFAATLEEVRQADIVLHVRDVSHPDAAAQRADVLAVLAQLGVSARASNHTTSAAGGSAPPVRAPAYIEVWNKADLAPDKVPMTGGAADAAVAVSAREGTGLLALVQQLDARVQALAGQATFTLALRRPGGVQRPRGTDAATGVLELDDAVPAGPGAAGPLAAAGGRVRRSAQQAARHADEFAAYHFLLAAAGVPHDAWGAVSASSSDAGSGVALRRPERRAAGCRLVSHALTSDGAAAVLQVRLDARAEAAFRALFPRVALRLAKA
jgi:GTP-binding protein HflX